MDLLNSDKFNKPKKNNPTIGTKEKPKKSIIISHDLHRQIKAAALEHDMFIHEVIEEAFQQWNKQQQTHDSK
jgi:hypothetical protein